MEELLEVLKEHVVYGLLFKTLATDVAMIEETEVKLRYRNFYTELSMRAERQHYHYRSILGRNGIKVLTERTIGKMYHVEYKEKGYLRESIYNGEMLRSECEVRLAKMLADVK